MGKTTKLIRGFSKSIKTFVFFSILMLFSGVSETYSGGESSDSQADDAKTQAIKKINDGLTQYLQPLGVQIQVVDVTESQGKLDFTAAIDLKQSPNLQKLFTATGVTGKNVQDLKLQGTIDSNLLSQSPSDLIKAINIKAPLKQIRLPGISAQQLAFAKPFFVISGKAPDNMKQFAATDPQQAVWIAIGADANLKIGNQEHKFGGNIIVGQDNKTKKKTVELVGVLDDPKKLFSFKGLEAQSFSIDAKYEDKKWDITFVGEVKINKASANFSMNSQKIKGKQIYVTTIESKDLKVSDLMGEGAPATFKEIEITKLEITGSDATAHIKFKGKENVELVAFHPTPQSYTHVAIILDSIGFDDLIPQLGSTPLKGSSLDNFALVYVPGQGEKGFDLKKLPTNSTLASTIKKVSGQDKVDFGKGVHFFANLDIKSSGEFKTILKSVGLDRETHFPLMGSMDPSIFGQKKGSKPKTQGLNFSAPLPKLKLPGVPAQQFAFEKPIFSINGDAPEHVSKGLLEQFGQDQQIWVEIGATLEVKFRDKPQTMDSYFIFGKDKASQAMVVDILGTAKSSKGIFSFPGLEADNLNIEAEYTKDAGGKVAWNLKFGGQGKINGKELSFSTTYDTSSKEYMVDLIDKDLSVADVFGSAGAAVPGFKDLKITEVKITNTTMLADLEFRGKTVELSIFSPDQKSRVLSLALKDPLAFTDLIEQLKDTPANGVSLDDLTLVYVGGSGAKIKVSAKDLPEQVGVNIPKVVKESIEFNSGVNFYANLDVKGSGEIGDILEFVGVSKNITMPLTGSVSPAVFNKKGSSGAKATSGMNLSTPLPKIKIPKLPGGLTFSAPSFNFAEGKPSSGAQESSSSGSQQKSSSGSKQLFVGVSSGLQFAIGKQKLDFDATMGHETINGKKELLLSAAGKMNWKSPFGITWLNLGNLGLSFAQSDTTSKVDLTGITSIGSLKNLNVDVDLQIKDGKIDDAFFGINSKVAFNEIPVLKSVPNADKFAFLNLQASTEGISGKTMLNAMTFDVAAFEVGGKYTFALNDNNVDFSKFIPKAKGTPLAQLHLTSAAIIMSEAGMQNTAVSALPLVAQSFFKDIYGSDSAKVNIAKGLTIAASLDPSKSSGGLKAIGVHEPMLVSGTVGGIFGGPPSVSIAVSLPALGEAAQMPKFFKVVDSISFFIKAIESGSGPDIEIGFTTNMTIHDGSKDVGFALSLELEIKDTGFGVNTVATVSNWNDVAGISGFNIEAVTLKTGLNDTGALKLGIAAKTDLGPEKVDIAVETDLLLEALGFPEDIAFKGTISELGVPVMIEIAESLAGQAGAIDASSIPLPVFKDVSFAFATPGASDPDLGLVGDGFAMKGSLWFLGQELGVVDASASPTAGVHFSGDIAVLKLGPVDLEKNSVLFNAGFTDPPEFSLTSSISIFGLTETTKVKFAMPNIFMEFESSLGGIFKTDIVMIASGIDLAKGTIGKDANFFVKGTFQEDLFAWMRTQGVTDVQNVFNELQAGLKEANATLQKAKDSVDSLQSKIDAEKAKMRQERAAAAAQVTAAENKVNSLQNSINSEHSGCHKKCAHWYDVGCYASKAEHCLAEDGLIAAKDVADGVLEAAKQAIEHFPTDLMDPEIAAWEAEKAIADVALDAAMDVVNLAGNIVSVVEKGAAALVKEIGESDALVVDKAIFQMDLNSFIAGHSPALMVLDLKIFGNTIPELKFAFKIPDTKDNLAFDVEQMAYIPIEMVLQLLDKELGSTVSKIVQPIVQKLGAQQSKIMDETNQLLSSSNLSYLETLPTLEKKYQKFLPDFVASAVAAATDADKSCGPTNVAACMSSLSNGWKGLAKQSGDLSNSLEARNTAIQQAEDDRRAALAKNAPKQWTDYLSSEPVVFSNQVLHFAHSDLCLSDFQGRVTLIPCAMTRKIHGDKPKNKISTPSVAQLHWSTKAVENTGGHLAIVHQGKCLTPESIASAAIKGSAVATLHMKACSYKIPKEDGVIEVADDQFGQLWKVLVASDDPNVKDDTYFRLMNRASAKCLRFPHPKASVNTMTAIWSPCNGVDHEVFKISKANKANVFHDRYALFKSPISHFCAGASGDAKKGTPIHVEKCDRVDVSQRWDFIENKDTKLVRFINRGTGWCLYPSNGLTGHPKKLVIQDKCDAQGSMHWKVIDVPGGFKIQSNDAKFANTCFAIKNGDHTPGEAIELVNCVMTGYGMVWGLDDFQNNYQWKQAGTNSSAKMYKTKELVRSICRIHTPSGIIMPGVWLVANEQATCSTYWEFGGQNAALVALPLKKKMQQGIEKKIVDGSKYKVDVLMSIEKAVWHNAGGKLPSNAIIGGRLQKSMIYICQVQDTDSAKTIRYGALTAKQTGCHVAMETGHVKIYPSYKVLTDGASLNLHQ